MTLEARSEVREMLGVKEGRWFGRLDDGSPKVKRMRRVYPRVDYTQAPWTVVICLGSRIKASTLRGRHRRFVGDSVFHTHTKYVFSWAPLLVGDTSEAVLSLATTSSTEFDSTYSNYIHQVQNIRWCTQQTVCS